MMAVNSEDVYGTPAIIDNSVLNEFAALGAVKLLKLVFAPVYMAENMIRDEVRFPNAEAAFDELAPIHIALDTEHGLRCWSEIMTKRKVLSRYDAEVIALAIERSLVCCTSDRAMMKTCDIYQVRRIGTLGVLACAYQHGHVNEGTFRSLVDKLFSLPNARYSESTKQGFKSSFPEIFGE
ncbi:hypothetical protein [Alicyclobacillus acidocaldarius]|nr:hypothetical protein [Alicyclobacillus acidocaldarius]